MISIDRATRRAVLRGGMVLIAFAFGQISDAAAVETPPVPIRQDKPLYRPWLRGPENAEGAVTLRFVVTPRGSVENVRVVQPSHPLLNAAAAAAIRRWTFHPGEVDGVKARFTMQITIQFQREGFLGESYLEGEFTCIEDAAGAELPALDHSASIPYPARQWRKKIGGEVQCDFRIASDGSVRDIAAISASDPAFAEAVTHALPKLHFAIDPTYVGQPRVHLRVRFIPVGQEKAAPAAPTSDVPALKRAPP